MALSDFVKQRDPELDEQEENFIKRIPDNASKVGIDIAEYTATNAILTDHRTAFTSMHTAKAAAKAAVALNKEKKLAAINELRRIAKKIKSSNGYTEEIGKDLGIIGTDVIPPDPSTMKPTLKVKLSGHDVIIEFDKQNMEGVRIYSKRGTQAGFEHIATDLHSPYYDTRAKLVEGSPEERQYYAFYSEDDSDIGIQSDVVTIVIP